MADMAAELEAAAFRLRRAGQDDLARELNAGMRRGVDPVPDKIRAGLGPHLPGAYAGTLDTDLAIRTAVRNAGGDAVVTVTATTRSGRRLQRLDAGVLEHPRWGDRRHWYAQAGRPCSRAGSPGPARRKSPGSAPNSSRHCETSAAKQPDRRPRSR